MMLVERRDEQNAADAAALAGARYVLTDQAAAETAARDIAQMNGFVDSDPNEVVNVYIPPIHGRYVNLPGFIEVQIQSTRPSIFGGVVGRANWPIGAFAVATNSQNLTFPFGMLALNPTMCKAIQVSGHWHRERLCERPIELERVGLHLRRSDRLQPDRWQHGQRLCA